MAINRWNEVLTIKLKRKGVYTVIIILSMLTIGLFLTFILFISDENEDFHTDDDTISNENKSSDTTTSSLLVSQSHDTVSNHDTGSHCDTGSSFDGGGSFGGDCGGGF